MSKLDDLKKEDDKAREELDAAITEAEVGNDIDKAKAVDDEARADLEQAIDDAE